MELTPTGIVVLLLAAGTLFYSTRVTLSALAFSLPFTATAVVNVGSGPEAFAITPGLVFGGLVVARVLVDLVRRRYRPRLPVPLAMLVLTLGVFALSVLVNVSNPATFVGFDASRQKFVAMSAAASLTNVTQLLYFTFWIMVVVAGAQAIRTVEQFIGLQRALVAGAVFASLWGLVQLATALAGVTYPWYVFNNSASIYARGFEQVVPGLNIPRVSSVAVEPSALAESLLAALMITSTYLLRGRHLLGRGWDGLAALLLIVVLLLSSSTTAYVGLAVIGMLAAADMLMRTTINVTLWRWLLPVLTVMLAGFATSPYLQHLVREFVLEKASSDSFSDRTATLQAAFATFQEAPLLGVGVGAVTVYSQPLWLLANTGIVGCAIFAASCVAAVISSLWRFRGMDRAAQIALLASLGAFVVEEVVMLIAGFSYVFGTFWLLVLFLCTPRAPASRSDDRSTPST